MIVLRVLLEGDGAWPDLIDKHKEGKLIELEGPMSVAALPGGMTTGKPSVAFRFDLPDGTAIFAQTSLALFLSAADMFRARYGDPRE